MRRDVRNPLSAGLDDLRSSPDQNVGIPNGGHAMVRRCLHADRDLAHAKVDGSDTMRFRQAKEWVGHEILRIAWSEAAAERAEPLELISLRVKCSVPRHGRASGMVSGEADCRRRARRCSPALPGARFRCLGRTWTV